MLLLLLVAGVAALAFSTTGVTAWTHADERIRRDYENNAYQQPNVTQVSAKLAVLHKLHPRLSFTSKSPLLYDPHKPTFQTRVPSLPCNLMFVKMLKVGGTTASGVIRQIARRHGLGGAFDGESLAKWEQLPAPKVWASTKRVSFLQDTLTKLPNTANTIPKQGTSTPNVQTEGNNFIIGWIRNPRARCMSSYYYFRQCPKEGRGVIAAPNETDKVG